MQLRQANADDALYVARHLRHADLLEVTASGALPGDSLLHGVRLGPSYVWVDDAGLPCVLFGAVPLDRLTASVWMVGTPGLEQHKLHLLRHVRPVVDLLNSEWPLLCNSADARNALHLRFIRWAGFTFFNTRRVSGLLFLDFARINTQCATPSVSRRLPSP